MCQKRPATTGLQNDLNLQAGRIRSKVDDFSTFLCRPVLMAFQKPGRHTFFCADRPIWPTPKEEEDGVNFFLKFEIGFPNTFHLIKFGKCEVVLDPRLLLLVVPPPARGSWLTHTKNARRKSLGDPSSNYSYRSASEA